MSYTCPACGEAANYTVCEKCGGYGKPQPPISHSRLCGLAEHEAVFAPNAELASLRARVAELEAALEAQQAVVDAAREVSRVRGDCDIVANERSNDSERFEANTKLNALDAALEKVKP